MPHPALGTLTLQFITAYDGPVRVELFDAQGRRVRLVLDEAFLTAGRHLVSLSRGARLQAGAYFFRITASDATHTGRVTILA